VWHACTQMLSFFQRITPEQALAQHTRELHASAEAMAQERVQLEREQLLRRGPGRPKKERDAADAIMAAAAAAAALSAPSVEHDDEQPPAKRGKYTNWFATPLIHDILAAYQRCQHSGEKAVAYLQRAHPRLPTEQEARFARLAASTIRSWHNDKGELLPRFQAVLNSDCTLLRRGPGEARALAPYPDMEQEIKDVLSLMRNKGSTVNIAIIQFVMRAVIARREPLLQRELQLSRTFVSCWAREQLHWTWRLRTTAASKLPDDWRARGVEMAKRIACNVQIHKVPIFLVVNVDQTGVHLCPSDRHTYAEEGSKSVAVVGAEDKRQITVCVASSMDGDLLPLQLIFEGKTDRCHPAHTASITEEHFHITHSENHWSNVETMKKWVEKVLLPFAERKLAAANLPHNSHIILLLDCWKVHTSGDFPAWLKANHPQIHLVYVPANCTSQLQVADVMLQRPFKAGIRKRFNEWAAAEIRRQIDDKDIIGLAPYLKMAAIKPHILRWCFDSWKRMQEGNARDFIKAGWQNTVLAFCNVLDPVKRAQAVEEALAKQLPLDATPDDEEQEEQKSWDEECTDEERDELDIMKERAQPTRAQPSRAARKQGRVQRFGGGIDPTRIDIDD
jgi:hypothetical protein